jgi:ABC-2 type transport system ATP-binding protein
MWDALKALQAEGVTILLTTHLMEEADKCDRLAILHRGRCVALGAPLDLKRKIGGDVITIHTADTATLSENILRRFGASPVVVDSALRIEIREGHKFIPQLVEAFPGAVEAVTVGKPTLEDVFIHETGQLFADN